MGWGTAFATGLVKGFTQNIKEEEAKRLSDRERFNKFDELLLKARFDKDANQSAVNDVAKLIQSARTEASQREPIDMFGTASDDVDIDFGKLQSTLYNVGSNDFLNIGTFKLKMNDSISSRYSKDRSDIAKKSGLELQALNDQLSTPEGRAAFEEHFNKSIDNKNSLRQFYLPAVNAVLAELRKDNTAPISAEANIQNYKYFADYLGLGADQKLKTEIDVIKQTDASRFSSPENPTTPDGLFAVSSSLFPGANVENGIQTISVKAFEENGIDIGLVDVMAATQGRDRDVFLVNFSSRFDKQTEFFGALNHAQKIAEMTRSGNKLDFTDLDKLVAVGDYLDKNITDAESQVKVIQGLRGSVLSESQREMIERKQATEDDFRLGKNREEAYKLALFGEGGSFSDFKNRVVSARTAKEQLLEYRNIVGNEIDTVKGIWLDSALKAVNAYFGDKGTFDQIVGMLGGKYKTEAEEGLIKSRLERIKSTGGARARRDTLAFIIAANMARAEDQGGRLSDGDIQRNLDKLAPGLTTKSGELQSIDQVIETIDSQHRLLAGYEAIIEIDGARGFSLETQSKLDALRIRDRALQNFRYADAGDRLASNQNTMSMEEASKLKDNRLFVPKDPSLGLVIKDDGRGNLVLLNNEGVVATGKAKDLTQYIQPKPTPVSPTTTTPAPVQPSSTTNQPTSQPTPQPTPVVSPSLNVISELQLTGEAILISGTNRYKLPGQAGQWEKRTNDKGESEYIQATTQD
jgi:hypothetical protein